MSIPRIINSPKTQLADSAPQNLSPLQASPLPKILRKKINRSDERKGKSRIYMDSPENRRLEELQEKKIEKNKAVDKRAGLKAIMNETIKKESELKTSKINKKKVKQQKQELN